MFNNNTYVIMTVLLVLFELMDCFEEGKDLIPLSRRVELWDVFRCCFKNVHLKGHKKVEAVKVQDGGEKPLCSDVGVQVDIK